MHSDIEEFIGNEEPQERRSERLGDSELEEFNGDSELEEFIGDSDELEEFNGDSELEESIGDGEEEAVKHRRLALLRDHKLIADATARLALRLAQPQA